MGDRDMSRQLTSGVLGRKKNLAVQLANEYIARVMAEPYGVIGAGILNWDIDGNPPADLFDAFGNINPVNYDSAAAKNAVIALFDYLINNEDFEKTISYISKDLGFILNSSNIIREVVNVKDTFNFEATGTTLPILNKNEGIVIRGNELSSQNPLFSNYNLAGKTPFVVDTSFITGAYVYSIGALASNLKGHHLRNSDRINPVTSNGENWNTFTRTAANSHPRSNPYRWRLTWGGLSSSAYNVYSYDDDQNYNLGTPNLDWEGDSEGTLNLLGAGAGNAITSRVSMKHFLLMVG